jgi:hypothetical protein
LNRKPTPHSIIDGNAWFAHFQALSVPIGERSTDEGGLETELWSQGSGGRLLGAAAAVAC